MFDTILGNKKEFGHQLYLRDDGKIQFRKLPIVRGWLVEYDGIGNMVRAWRHNYKLLKRFDGYKSIPSGMYTVSYNRDTVLDLYNRLPDTGGDIEKKRKTFFRDLLIESIYSWDRKIKPVSIPDKIVIVLSATIILLAIGIALKAVL